MKKDILRKSLAVAAALTVFLSASAYTALGSISAKAYTNADKANFDVTEKANSIALTYKGTGREVTIPPMYYSEYGDKGVVDEVTFNLDHDIELTIPEGFNQMPEIKFDNYSSISHIKKISITATKITEIPFNCGFSGYSALESIELPPNLTVIPRGAFAGCESLKSIDIPDTVRFVQSMAFKDCKSLENAVIPYGVSILDEAIFINCSSLKTVTLPNTIVKIIGEPFEGCTSLETIYYIGTKEEFDKIPLNDIQKAYYASLIQYQPASSQTSEASGNDSDGNYESQPSDNSESRVTSWIETETEITESTPDNTVLIVVFSVIGGFLVLGAAAAVVIIIAVKKKRQ